LVLVALGLAGCSSQLNQTEAESKLSEAHESCLSKSLKSEIPHFEIIFEPGSSQLLYKYEEGQSGRTFVQCVSTQLFGEDVTSLVHTPEENLNRKLVLESSGWQGTEVGDDFVSVYHLGWNYPISFERFDYFGSRYWFSWFSRDE
jgi:hypothetical protein